MALSDYKIKGFQKPVSALDDTPQMSAAALKEWFDSNSTNELKTSINGIIDEVEGELSGKVNKEEGRGLSENNYSNEEKLKLSTLDTEKQHEHTNKEVLDKINEAPVFDAPRDDKYYLRQNGQWIDSMTPDLMVFGSQEANSALYAGEAGKADVAVMDTQNRFITDTYATKEEVGDIESALDSIIAIQNLLIGGDGE